jgi:hypothetical protein
MAENLPFPIETIAWDEMPESDREFFCFEDEYLPLPSEHAHQIHRLTSGDARRIWQWLGPSLPPGWPESKPHFQNETVFKLEHENWNSDDGVQVVRKWLHDRGVPYASDAFLVYEAHQIVRMPWKLLVKYWDALAWSVRYSKIALDHTRQWACCFHHEDVIVFGSFSDNRDITIR